ncbi:MAG TPA: hypothetical protein VGI96_39955 [Streptosporangiaceae bacterium]|jgi:hypothetical protein
MPSGLARRESDALAFTAEMHAVQLDQLAVVLGVTPEQASGLVSRWRNLGLAESARLGPGPPWVWVSQTGLAACGLSYPAGPPAPSRLARTRAVTAVRLTLQATTAYRRARATWRGERGIRAGRPGGFRGSVPDGELHWPRGAAVSWAGQCWAVQAEVARATAGDTAEVMRELLARAGDGPAPAAVRPGRPERYARVLYLCSPAALPVVLRARDAQGRAGARIEIRDLPPGAVLALAPGRPALPLAPGRPAPPFAPGRPALARAPGRPAPQPPGVSSVRR